MSPPVGMPETITRLSARSAVDGLSRRRLPPALVAAQSVSAVSPAAAAVTTPALVHGAAGGAAVWSMLLATALAVLVAVTINQFTRRLAAPGSLYTFVAKGLGPRWAMLCGTALCLGYSAVTASSLLGSAAALGRAATALGVSGSALPGAGVMLAVVIGTGLLAAVLVARGVRVASMLLVALEAVAVGMVLVALGSLVVPLVSGGPGSPTGGPLGPAALLPAAPTVAQVPSILAGAAVAVAAFVGFESSGALGAEAFRPFRSVPRAVLWTAVGTGLLFVAGTLVQSAYFGRPGYDSSGVVAPLVDLTRRANLGALSLGLDLAVAVSFFACAMASGAALARLLFAAARDDLLPRWLARSHPRRHTPHRAVPVVLLLTVVPAAVAVVARVDVRTAMDRLITVSGCGYVLAYVLVCGAAVGFLRRIGEATVRSTVAAGVAAGGLGLVLVGGIGSHLPTGGAIVLGSLAAVVTGWLGWDAVCRRRRPGAVAGLGAYDQTTSTDVWWTPDPAPLLELTEETLPPGALRALGTLGGLTGLSGIGTLGR